MNELQLLNLFSMVMLNVIVTGLRVGWENENNKQKIENSQLTVRNPHSFYHFYNSILNVSINVNTY